MAIVWGLAGVYLLLAVVLWALQERITFPAPRSPLPDPAQTIGYGERIQLQMQDGTRLVGWYLPPENAGGRRPSAPFAALLWFYGNGETIGAIWPVIRDFRPPHAALLVVDYPGYGASGGRATEAGMNEAADLAYAALAARSEIDRHRIYAYGRSLGSAAATHTADTHEVAGVILESPFTRARGMARQQYSIFPIFLVLLLLDQIGIIMRDHTIQGESVVVEAGVRVVVDGNEELLIQGKGGVISEDVQRLQNLRRQEAPQHLVAADPLK